MITEQTFYGNARRTAAATPKILTASCYRCQHISSVAAGNYVKLDDARNFQVGGPIFCIFNHDTVDNLPVKDFTNVTIFTIKPGKVMTLSLANNDTPAGKWVAKAATIK